MNKKSIVAFVLYVIYLTVTGILYKRFLDKMLDIKEEEVEEEE
jgi:hypothetical protein